EVAASSGSLAAAGSPGYVSSVSRMFLTRISVLPSWPPSIIHPTASFGAVCLIFPIANDSGGPGGGHLWLFRVGKNLEVPHFKRVLRHLFVRPLTPSPGLLPLQRPIQCASTALRSAHHAPEQPPGQVALRQHQPVVPRVLDQPAAGLHQPLLQAGQGPTFDLLRQHQPPPLNAFCGPEPWHTSGW